MKNDGKDNLSRIADAHPNSALAQQHKKGPIKKLRRNKWRKHRRRQRGKK